MNELIQEAFVGQEQKFLAKAQILDDQGNVVAEQPLDVFVQERDTFKLTWTLGFT